MSTLHRSFVLACLLGSAVAAHALSLSSAARSPANSNPTSTQSVFNIDHTASLNPERAPVQIAGGYTSVTSVFVDADNGIVRSFASGTLTAPLAVSGGGYSSANGTLAATGIFRGAAPGPVPITVSMVFDGSFAGIVGQPTLGLIGTLVARGSLTNDRYTSQLAFSRDRDSGGSVEAMVTATRQFDIGGIQQSEPYAGATPSIASAASSFLAGTVRATFLLSPGERLTFSAGINVFNDGESAEDGSALIPSAGTVDASQSARLLITVPAGYYFDSDNLMLTNNVVAVPEPSAAVLLALGVGLLLTTGPRLRRRGMQR